jgi:predicted RNase H-like HicB family nuclease
MHKYELVICWSRDDECFIAEVPELAGCTAHGDSPSAALANAQQAIDLWLDTARQLGREVPKPKGLRGQLV